MTCLSDVELLEQVEREQFDAPHVRDCGSCQLRLAELRVAARILRELRPAQALPTPARGSGRLGLIATAATILAVAGTLAWRQTRDRVRDSAISAAPDGDAAVYDGETVTLSWRESLGPLGGKEVRLYRRMLGGEETLLATTRETTYVDPGVAPDRRYVYRVVPVGSDGKDSKLVVILAASTVLQSHVAGEFKIHYQQGFSFETRRIVPQAEADLALSQLAGGFQMRTYVTPYGGTNGPDDDPGQLAPVQGLGSFDNLVEFPSGPLRTTLRTDERYPASLQVFALRTKGGGIAKVQVLGPEKGFTGSWNLHPLWVRYVFAPAAPRFLPTLQEVQAWAPALDDAARKKAEGCIRDLSAGQIDARARAAARLKQMGPAVLPVLREAAPSEDAEANLRLQEVASHLSLRCRPLRLALGAPDPELREAAAKVLRLLLGEARPLEFEGEAERRKLEEKVEKEQREQAARLRKAKVDAVRVHFPLSEEARKKIGEQVATWRDAKEDARVGVAREIVAAGPGSAVVVADLVGMREDAVALIDLCLAAGKNLVFIDSRSNREAEKTKRCYYSFFSGSHGYDRMVSIEFGNGGDVFQVQMYGGQKNLLADLGAVDFAAARAPKAFDDRKDWEDRVPAVVGHTYLEHLWEDQHKFYVKFKVLAMESGQSVLILWERLGP